MLRWRDGSFSVEHGAVNSIVALAQAENVFLNLLEQFTAQGRPPGPNYGPNYAPTQFASDPKGNGIGSKLFAQAMAALFSNGKLRVEERGPPSRRYKYLVATLPP